MKIDDLRKKREAAVAKAEAIHAKSEAEDRDKTPEEDEFFNAAVAETKSLDKRIADQLGLDADKAIQDAERPQRTHATVNTTVVTTSGDVGTAEWRVGRNRAEDNPTRRFRNLGEFAMAVRNAHAPSVRAVDERLQFCAAATGLNQATGPEGGYLVPPSFSETIWDGMNVGEDNLLARTDQYTVDGESLTFNANAETSRVTSLYGGVIAYWIAEAAQLTGTKPTFRQVTVRPQQLAALCYATDKLLANATSLNQWITKAATAAINFKVGDAIINGTGAGQPLGLLNSGCTVSVSKESGQAAATIQHANIVKMFARMHKMSRPNAVWLINQDIEPQLYSMTLALGTSALAVYTPPGGLSAAPYATLMGKPVIPIEYCATLGTVGDIILADMRAYITATQGGIDSAVSMHLRFDYLEQVFRFVFAVDGQSWLASAMTPYKGTATLSPFVTLATRA